MNHKNNSSKHLKKGINNTADTKEGMDRQTFCALIVFQSSYLLFEHFVTFDIVLIRHIGLGYLKDSNAAAHSVDTGIS